MRQNSKDALFGTVSAVGVAIILCSLAYLGIVGSEYLYETYGEIVVAIYGIIIGCFVLSIALIIQMADKRGWI